jgi:hypothetical protein
MAKHVSNNNSTSLLLNANLTFTGIVESVSIYESVSITIVSNQSSATDGIKLYLGPTADNLSIKYTYSYTANEDKLITLKLTDNFFKLVYINGSTNQASFNIQTFYSYVLPQGTITLPDLIEVELHDAAGNSITSTSNALDVNIKNASTITSFDPKQYDLFGNIKVSNSFTLLDIAHIYDKNTLFMDEYTRGAATSVFDSTNASVLMSVNVNNDVVIRQSRLYSAYQPGKSLCIRMTGVINAKTSGNGTNTVSRIGYFDENNGLYFEYSGGIYYIVERKNGVDTKTSQSNWNIDRLDGNSPSGINIDFTKNIIYYIELAYLGVGIVKYGFVFSGTLYVAHINYHTTITYPYIVTPNLPMRWELTSTSTTSNTGQLICTCGSVQSEGGYSLIGNPFGMGMSTTSFTVDNNNTGENYVMSIRLKASNRKTVKLVSLSLICTSGSSAIYNLYRIKSPTTIPITGNPATGSPAVNYSNITNSVTQYHFNTSTSGGTPVSNFLVDLTNADLLYRHYFTANESLNLTNFSTIGGPIYLTAGIDTTAYGGGFYSDYLVLVVKQITNNNETYYGSLNWIEL